MRLFKLQDRVKYSVRFLRSISAYTGKLPFARGTVTRVSSFGAPDRQVVTVRWDRASDAPAKVLNTNLALIEDPETRYT